MQHNVTQSILTVVAAPVELLVLIATSFLPSIPPSALPARLLQPVPLCRLGGAASRDEWAAGARPQPLPLPCDNLLPFICRHN